MGTIPDGAMRDFLVVGELSLDGVLRPIRGALPVAVCAKATGIPYLVVPRDNAAEAGVVEGVKVFGVKHLSEVVQLLEKPEAGRPANGNGGAPRLEPRSPVFDFREVKGQETAKRALEIAAAGRSQPADGRPARLGEDHARQEAAGHSAAARPLRRPWRRPRCIASPGPWDRRAGCCGERPFRAPHHSVSQAGLVGGGVGMARPGEVSLAHHGVLFLDEFPEFPRNVLELLRQPLEDGQITIARSNLSLTFPSSFMLVAAMNPCPCGYFGDSTRDCHCTPAMIQRYVGRISGPLLDRIDIHVEVPPVKYRELRSETPSECSLDIRERVEAGRRTQMQRGYPNARMPSKVIREFCRLDEAGERTLEVAVQKMGLSARAHDRILKVARTIADLEGRSARSACGTSPKRCSTAASTAPIGCNASRDCGWLLPLPQPHLAGAAYAPLGRSTEARPPFSLRSRPLA